MLKEYFLEYRANELKNILSDPNELKCFPIYIDFIELFGYDPEKSNKILKHPRHYLPLCDLSAVKAQEEVAEGNQIVKKQIRTRIHGIPENINQAEIGEFVFAAGCIVRISQPSVLINAKHLLCKKCKHVNIFKLEWETGKFSDEKECENCKKKSLNPVTSLQHQECVDYQEIKLQDKTQNTSNPLEVAIQVVLLEDLVDTCTTGDNVIVNGFLIRRWGNFVEGERPLSTTFMMANNLTVRKKTVESEFSKNEITKIFSNYWKNCEGNPVEGRDNIVSSICPQLYGMYSVKLALAIVLAGGVPKATDSGLKIRGDIHLLMCGDPGTGKSQILKTAARLSSRSVVTTGIGSTAAGLTAAAVKDSDGWHLEAGALVSASGGVCCIDEFTTMSNNDMSSIHEAMEQQTISIAKAGLLSTLHTKCSVIAAINPVGGRLEDKDQVKMGIAGPLLSRFDLVLFLKDNCDEEWDLLVSNHILQNAMSDNVCGNEIDDNGQNYSMSDSMRNDADLNADSDIFEMGTVRNLPEANINKLWNEKTLREYFSHIHGLKPTMSKEAELILRSVYAYHRQRPNRQQERTTVRLMDSLIRVAEAHAKLMYRTQVLVMDAIFASKLINSTNGACDEDNQFPNDPMSAYKEEGTKLLKLLKLDNLLEQM